MPQVSERDKQRLKDQLEQALKDFDFQKARCKIAGRRLRSACKTISPGDQAGFRNGSVAQHLVGMRVEDLQEAWSLPKDGHIANLTRDSGLSYQDVAELHLSAFVPICLEIEDGRHTCHPDEGAGKAFHDGARSTLIDQIRTGRLQWRAPGRGGTGGELPPSLPSGGLPVPGPGSPRRDAPGAPGGASTGVLVAVAAVALLALRR